jgi:hypothetical protein
MTLAAILALLLAQATPLPSPTAGRIQAPTLSFADGLQRLINHAAYVSPQDLVFSQDLGPQVGRNGAEEIYALNFTIAGFTRCQVVSIGYDMGYASCEAYFGPDAAVARSTFNDVEDELHVFAGHGSSFSVKSFSKTTGLNVGKTTVAEYRPNRQVRVSINMLEANTGPSGVTLQVTHVPEY